VRIKKPERDNKFILCIAAEGNLHQGCNHVNDPRAKRGGLLASPVYRELFHNPIREELPTIRSKLFSLLAYKSTRADSCGQTFGWSAADQPEQVEAQFSTR
jgi:hypothetical protein